MFTPLHGDLKAVKRNIDHVLDVSKTLDEAMEKAGLIGMVWYRRVGIVRTLLSDGFTEALDRFTEDSGVSVLVLERVDGDAVKEEHIDLLRAHFPELEITMKEGDSGGTR